LAITKNSDTRNMSDQRRFRDCALPSAQRAALLQCSTQLLAVAKQQFQFSLTSFPVSRPE
jgi:hypothetical protein